MSCRLARSKTVTLRMARGTASVSVPLPDPTAWAASEPGSPTPKLC